MEDDADDDYLFVKPEWYALLRRLTVILDEHTSMVNDLKLKLLLAVWQLNVLWTCKDDIYGMLIEKRKDDDEILINANRRAATEMEKFMNLGIREIYYESKKYVSASCLDIEDRVLTMAAAVPPHPQDANEGDNARYSDDGIFEDPDGHA